MLQMPFYIPFAFIITVLCALFFVYKASGNSKKILAFIAVWLLLQAGISLSQFYTVTHTTPPRFLLLIVPPLIYIVYLFSSGKKWMAHFDIKLLSLLHIIRIPIELVLFALYTHSFIPKIMTFEGRNWDILCGISAPLIYYFGFVQKKLSYRFMLIWNYVCIGLLVNIVLHAILSAPFSFQQFGFDQPNIAVFYFPFVWLPGFLVPLVLFSHITTIKFLRTQQKISI